MRPLKVVGFGVPDAWVGLSLVGFSGFWRVLGASWSLKNGTSKIIEIHCKKQCFGLRRLQDGAKMDSKNAMFWSVKILRIHGKKQGLGSMSVF